jgi:NADH dehydrogenase
MRVFVSGGCGFVGSSVIQHLINTGHSVRCLTRNKFSPQPIPGVEFCPGDILQSHSIASGLADCDAVIHLVGIIRAIP